jgi:hypothetical protein
MGSSHWAYAVKMESGDLRGGINLRAPSGSCHFNKADETRGGGGKSQNTVQYSASQALSFRQGSPHSQATEETGIYFAFYLII